MTPKRKQRLVIVLAILVGVSVAVGLALFALSQNINLFYSPTQIAQGEAPRDTRIRAGGMVVEGSVLRASDSLQVRFELTDYAETVPVEFTGILPDLFREGQGIVAQGSLDNQGVFQAVEVLAKHDENYMPPEVAEALQASGKMPQPEAEVFNK
ncbi:cytochrome c-type biogenesis protein CcmE [Marinobacterium nitratireducens]|uniref:Cytochrome c-type biogenesis protein CcmE n=1 Tax=Marinobacterium nitratireducens TaxID=518897 RepID=A0A917ZK08_9GAMM|nr:cytochrome c maturation protein CcmE [Marinobacterium nitratireducens]GGO85079.1 cytochrome c-type biogenesis protein CcmE [Marinobacterium nitratireducens]